MIFFTIRLLFSSSGDYPNLHSFPTRRSSDLRRAARAGVMRLVLRAIRSTGPPGDDRRPSCEQPVRPDRKSTRLNSSHPSISYAVFCLKKKTNDIFYNTGLTPYIWLLPNVTVE